MSRLVFLRHAHSTANEAGVLAGRMEGVSLSKQGLAQAEALIDRIGPVVFKQIRVSPLSRCQETIRPWLNSAHSKNVESYSLDDGLNEVDYGAWSGRKLKSLQREKMWKEIQSKPSKVTFPNGESIKGAQKRALAAIFQAHEEDRKGNLLFISHGDIIKATIAALLTIKLDNFQQLVVDPAAISILEYDGKSSRLITFNDTSSSVTEILVAEKRSGVLLGGGAGSGAKARRVKG